jgi:hypothetical protein
MTYTLIKTIRHRSELKMQAKLTLRLEDTLIQQAKSYAKSSGKSVSQIVADYFALLNKQIKEPEPEFTPLVKSLKGVLSGAKVDREDYFSYLEEKYL